MIYFMQMAGNGRIRIGYGKNVERRRKNHEWCYGQPMVLLATMPGGRAEEKEIHDRFGHLRFGETEQFEPAAELMEFIGRPLFVSANPPTSEPDPVRITIPVFLDDAGRPITDPGVIMIRQRLGLTQRKFAEAIGYSLRTVQGWEIGRPPSREALCKMANLLKTRK